MDKQELLKQFQQQCHKALGHLNYSFKKVSQMELIREDTPEEQLESWESFASRFSRTSDIFISKILRLMILERDPAFRGSVIDLLNEAEKAGWIQNAKVWRRIRELRNIAAHEYTVEDLQKLYTELLQLCPHILEVQDVIEG